MISPERISLLQYMVAILHRSGLSITSRIILKRPSLNRAMSQTMPVMTAPSDTVNLTMFSVGLSPPNWSERNARSKSDGVISWISIVFPVLALGVRVVCALPLVTAESWGTLQHLNYIINFLKLQLTCAALAC